MLDLYAEMAAMHGKRILIVEDHPESAQALQGMIARRGGTSENVATKAEAQAVIRIATERGPKIDLIVSDLGLPDSSAPETLDWLADLGTRGFTACAMSGIEDPDIIQRAAHENVCMILKGTSAEGIMESLFYAMMRSDPNYAPIAAKEIVANRSMVREIPLHIKAWAFFNWPKWVQVCSSITAVIVLFGTIVTGASAVLHTLDDRSVAAEAGRQAAVANKHLVDVNTAHLATLDSQVRSLEDDRLTIKNSLTSIQVSVDKLDHKLDERDLRTDAMWQQRQTGQTNQDLVRRGKQGLPNADGTFPAAPTPSPK